MTDLLQTALDLYKLNNDPLTLDAIRVLANPDDPSYADAKSMIEAQEEARQVLFPPV
jgi:hypothetical protein